MFYVLLDHIKACLLIPMESRWRRSSLKNRPVKLRFRCPLPAGTARTMGFGLSLVRSSHVHMATSGNMCNKPERRAGGSWLSSLRVAARICREAGQNPSNSSARNRKVTDVPPVIMVQEAISRKSSVDTSELPCPSSETPKTTKPLHQACVGLQHCKIGLQQSKSTTRRPDHRLAKMN